MTSEACRTCGGGGLVCENHPDRPWTTSMAGGCDCGAGMACPTCAATHNATRDHDSQGDSCVLRPAYADGCEHAVIHMQEPSPSNGLPRRWWCDNCGQLFVVAAADEAAAL